MDRLAKKHEEFKEKVKKQYEQQIKNAQNDDNTPHYAMEARGIDLDRQKQIMEERVVQDAFEKRKQMLEGIQFIDVHNDFNLEVGKRKGRCARCANSLRCCILKFLPFKKLILEIEVI